MFTGIVTDIGEVVEIAEEGATRRIAIQASYPPDGIALGASISTGGICLTVTHVETRGNVGCVFTVDASAETVAVTTLGDWRAGTRVNLERALRIGDELGGHIVSGHVDGVAGLVGREDSDGTALMTFRAPPDLARFIAEKGSVALDGTSLTVNRVSGTDFTTMLIPHTLAVTTWGGAQVGARVNLEVDTMARYAARLAEFTPGR